MILLHKKQPRPCRFLPSYCLYLPITEPWKPRSVLFLCKKTSLCVSVDTTHKTQCWHEVDWPPLFNLQGQLCTPTPANPWSFPPCFTAHSSWQLKGVQLKPGCQNCRTQHNKKQGTASDTLLLSTMYGIAVHGPLWLVPNPGVGQTQLETDIIKTREWGKIWKGRHPPSGWRAPVANYDDHPLAFVTAGPESSENPH